MFLQDIDVLLHDQDRQLIHIVVTMYGVFQVDWEVHLSWNHMDYQHSTRNTQRHTEYLYCVGYDKYIVLFVLYIV